MNTAIVIGGGILGAATAWRLAGRGVRVFLLEAQPMLGGGATRASFSWFNAGSKPPRNYHQLNVDGMNYYHRLRNEFGNPRWLHPSGHIEWNGSDGGAALLRDKVDRLVSWGYSAELLPVPELRYLEPELIAPDGVDHFAYYPQEGYVDPLDMIGDMASRARLLGAHIRTGVRVEELLLRGDRVAGVVTADGERLEADIVVSCTGATTPFLLEKLGWSLPMSPTTGMIAVSSPTPARLTSVHNDHLMNIRPDGAGRIMMRHHDFDKQVTPETPERPLPEFLDRLLDRVATVLPAVASARIDAMHITTRPIPGDGHPVVGGIDGLEGLYLIVAHSVATTGPLLGDIAAREMVTGVQDPRLADFRPARCLTMGQATEPR